MAYAATKIEALSEIISTEMQSLGQDIRAVSTSATALVEGVMDDEFHQSCDSGDT